MDVSKVLDDDTQPKKEAIPPIGSRAMDWQAWLLHMLLGHKLPGRMEVTWWRYGRLPVHMQGLRRTVAAVMGWNKVLNDSLEWMVKIRFF